MRKANRFGKKDFCGSRSNVSGTSKASRALDEAVIIKDFCKDIVGNPDYVLPNRSDLEKEVAASYSDEVIDSVDETQSGYVHALAGQIYRFGKSWQFDMPKAKAVIPEEPVMLDLSDSVITDFIDDDEIAVTFDAVVYDPTKGEVTGIVFKRGVPKVTETNRGYSNIYNNVELHLMNLALRKFINQNHDQFGLKVGDKIHVFSAFYYMKKTQDKSDSTYFDDYFVGNCPIRALGYDNCGRPDRPEFTVSDDTDEKNFLKPALSGSGIKDAFEKMKKGDKEAEQSLRRSTLANMRADIRLIVLLNDAAGGFTKDDMKESEDCESCPDYFMCYYKLAPKPVEEEHVVKKRAKINPTPEQQAIIDARSGIFVCNAVPGSGKTETAVKERTVAIVKEELERVKKMYQNGEDISEYLTPNGIFVTKDSRKANTTD